MRVSVLSTRMFVLGTKRNLEINNNHFEHESCHERPSRQTVGAVVVVFNYKPRDGKAEIVKFAEKIRDDMQAETPNAAVLFGPAAFEEMPSCGSTAG